MANFPVQTTLTRIHNWPASRVFGGSEIILKLSAGVHKLEIPASSGEHSGRLKVKLTVVRWVRGWQPRVFGSSPANIERQAVWGCNMNEGPLRTADGTNHPKQNNNVYKPSPTPARTKAL